jgi:hypothetical protein
VIIIPIAVIITVVMPFRPVSRFIVRIDVLPMAGHPHAMAAVREAVAGDPDPLRTGHWRRIMNDDDALRGSIIIGDTIPPVSEPGIGMMPVIAEINGRKP